MSILVKGMKMPKSCPMCPMSHWQNQLTDFSGCEIVPGKKYALRDDKEFGKLTGRPKWCPLVEVSEEPKTGAWIEDPYGFNRCDQCGFEYDNAEFKTPYCPNCAAKMEDGFIEGDNIEISEITIEAADAIIGSQKPIGCFYCKDGDTFVGIDNSTGDAWTEEFSSLHDCVEWLMGGSDEDE